MGVVGSVVVLVGVESLGDVSLDVLVGELESSPLHALSPTAQTPKARAAAIARRMGTDLRVREVRLKTRRSGPLRPDLRANLWTTHPHRLVAGGFDEGLK